MNSLPNIVAGSPAKSYIHIPLESINHIRLLELLPAQQSDQPLECTFRQDKLSNLMDPYDAVSYTWGVPSFCCTLRCVEHDSYLHITKNLDTLLRRFRDKFHTKILWVDAVCINQQDDGEKSKQVPLMNQIYRFASKVLAWLGEGGIEEKAIPYIHGLSRRARPDQIVLSPISPPTVEDRSVGFEDIGNDSELMIIMNSFLALTWFRRKWVIQEIVLNTELYLHYGQSSISWLRFMSTLKYIEKKTPSGFQLQSFSSAKVLYNLWKQWSFTSAPKGVREFRVDDSIDKIMATRLSLSSGNLLHLVVAFEDHLCSDPRDKIYALGALAGIPLRTYPTIVDGIYWEELASVPSSRKPRLDSIAPMEDHPFIIDYNQSVGQCYKSFAASAISRGHVVWILAQACERTHQCSKHEIPSWAPDWEIPSRDTSILTHQVDMRPLEINDQSLTLVVRAKALVWGTGHHFVSIARSVVYSRSSCLVFNHHSLEALVETVLNPESQAPISHRFYSNLIGEMTRMPPDYLSLTVHPETMNKTSWKDLNRLSFNAIPWEQRHDFSTIMNYMTEKANRTIFLTIPFTDILTIRPVYKGCYFGLCSCVVEAGDQVLAVETLGGHILSSLILRPDDESTSGFDGSPGYRLIGNAVLLPLILLTKDSDWAVLSPIYQSYGAGNMNGYMGTGINYSGNVDIKLRLV
ncbi:heterokaryon incompatibility protein-domain-containing protein [Dendryphion nanum]|uniref:Heterokaryon incompatibility protein-domain-containing protein n=1 Tax=Dendryphion nanum TaxID=256645 RepID=A0A9P9IM63_9PLEO|nr:heterokaryon incompatibility protein-domain-containing protein [Dendryphion nanum]